MTELRKREYIEVAPDADGRYHYVMWSRRNGRKLAINAKAFPSKDAAFRCATRLISLDPDTPVVEAALTAAEPYFAILKSDDGKYWWYLMPSQSKTPAVMSCRGYAKKSDAHKAAHKVASVPSDAPIVEPV
jgi:uncharacterized protein YegP (UPF0339 family)